MSETVTKTLIEVLGMIVIVIVCIQVRGQRQHKRHEEVAIETHAKVGMIQSLLSGKNGET